MGMGRELEGLELVPRDNSMTVVKAEVSNARLSNLNPPYRAGTSTGTYTTEVETTYSRVYTEGGNSQQSGRWVLNHQDIEGLTPAEIQAKFALPETPTNITDVVVPAGTGITAGQVAPNFGFDPPAGTMQYEIRDLIPMESFTNSRILPEIMPITPVIPETIMPETIMPEIMP